MPNRSHKRNLRKRVEFIVLSRLGRDFSCFRSFTPTHRSVSPFPKAVDKSAVLNEGRNVMQTEGVAVTAPPNKKTIEQQFSVAEIQ